MKAIVSHNRFTILHENDNEAHTMDVGNKEFHVEVDDMILETPLELQIATDCLEGQECNYFSRQPWNLWKVINQIHSLFVDINTTLLHQKLDKPTGYVGWKPPIAPSIKLNIDESSFGDPGISGFGGVLRDQTSKCLSSFSGNYGNTTCLKAALFAVYHGLKTAWQRGFRHVVCESDSKIALGLIQDHVDPFHPYFSLALFIRDR
ncbi:hypothetical protein JHK87_033100 [Glycine soja]|nr:hypothetical protein JHK87_033100 [Glycine soja]